MGAAARAGGAAARVRHAGGGHGGLRPTRDEEPGVAGYGQKVPSPPWQRGRESAGGRQRVAAGSIHSRGSASLLGHRRLAGRVRGECATRSGRGPRARPSLPRRPHVPVRTRPRAPRAATQAASCGRLADSARRRPARPPGPGALVQLVAAGRGPQGRVAPPGVPASASAPPFCVRECLPRLPSLGGGRIPCRSCCWRSPLPSYAPHLEPVRFRRLPGPGGTQSW